MTDEEAQHKDAATSGTDPDILPWRPAFRPTASNCARDPPSRRSCANAPAWAGRFGAGRWESGAPGTRGENYASYVETVKWLTAWTTIQLPRGLLMDRSTRNSRSCAIHE